jgi:hypothetical protein
MFIAGFSDSDYGNCIEVDDLFRVICSNSEIQQFLGGHRNKNLCPHLLWKPNM